MPIQLDAHKAPISALAFAPRRALLASGGEETAVLVWEPRKQTRPIAFGVLDDVVTQVAWSGAGDALVACSAAGKVAAFDLREVARA